MSPDVPRAATGPGASQSLLLRPLSTSDEPEARQAHLELAADDFDFLLDERSGEAWPAYVERLAQMRRGRGLEHGRVPATFLVAEVDRQIVGRVSIRHALNAELSAGSGHIGYAVRPGARRRGHATEILRQALLIARTEGVELALVTCDAANAASAATIEACGGRFESPAPADGDDATLRRYWIRT